MNKPVDINKAKILLVDDKPNNLIALEKLLKGLQLNIYRAYNGNDALALTLENDFTLVLLDVQMPQMDGFEVAHLMRSNPQTSSIPITFVTAISTEQKYISIGHKVGAVDYLTKPIDPAILKAKVSVFCELFYQRKKLEALLLENKIIRNELEKSNDKLNYLATHDALTNIPNRLHFEKDVKEKVYIAYKLHKKIALLTIDLNKFKSINDNYGHTTGDQLLIEVAKRLQKLSKNVMRIGGDEFAIVLTEKTKIENDAKQLAQNILDALNATYYLESHTVNITASIGIACLSGSRDDFKSLYKNADTAMYEVKKSSLTGYKVYSSN